MTEELSKKYVVLDNAIRLLENQIQELKNQITKDMESNGISTYKDEYLSVIHKGESRVETIDLTRLRKEDPSTYNNLFKKFNRLSIKKETYAFSVK